MQDLYVCFHRVIAIELVKVIIRYLSGKNGADGRPVQRTVPGISGLYTATDRRAYRTAEYQAGEIGPLPSSL